MGHTIAEKILSRACGRPVKAGDEVLAQTRAGRQIMNLGDGAKLAAAVPASRPNVAPDIMPEPEA